MKGLFMAVPLQAPLPLPALPAEFTDGAQSAAIVAVELSVVIAVIIFAALLLHRIMQRFGTVPGSSSRSGGFGSTEKGSSGQQSLGRENYRNR